MPKNEQGEVKCINHPQQSMIAGAISVNLLDASILTDIKHLDNDLVVTAYLCLQCEYMELYRGLQPKNTTE